MIARCVLVVTTAILQVLVTCSHMETNTSAPWVIIVQPVQAQSQSLAWQVHLSTKVRLIPPKLQVRPWLIVSMIVIIAQSTTIVNVEPSIDSNTHVKTDTNAPSVQEIWFNALLAITAISYKVMMVQEKW